jgi:predicted ATPase
MLAALPGATVYEVGEWGLRQRPWMDLALVDRWTRFLLDPQHFVDGI